MATWRCFNSSMRRGSGSTLGACAPAPRPKRYDSRTESQFAIDGPFSETKEVLGGFYLIECASMGEAVEWAMKIPHFGDPRYSGVEIRPLWEREDY